MLRYFRTGNWNLSVAGYSQCTKKIIVSEGGISILALVVQQ
jgi:hypothetical protein